jgi:hypothetical protein
VRARWLGAGPDDGRSSTTYPTCLVFRRKRARLTGRRRGSREPVASIVTKDWPTRHLARPELIIDSHICADKAPTTGSRGGVCQSCFWWGEPEGAAAPHLPGTVPSGAGALEVVPRVGVFAPSASEPLNELSVPVRIGALACAFVVPRLSPGAVPRLALCCGVREHLVVAPKSPSRDGESSFNGSCHDPPVRSRIAGGIAMEGWQS